MNATVVDAEGTGPMGPTNAQESMGEAGVHGDDDDARRSRAALGANGKGPHAGNKRVQQKAATRRRLIEAATEVFLRDAPETASLEEIAALAGVQRKTLLYHFGNRAGLFQGVLLHYLEAFRGLAQDVDVPLASYFEAYLRLQTLPIVKLVRRLDELVLDTPDSPTSFYWHSALVTGLERRLANAGSDPADAQRYAPVVALALEAMGRRIAQDVTPEADVPEFVNALCDLLRVNVDRQETL